MPKTLSKDGNEHEPLILFMANDITGDLKDKEELETTRELLDETEELLQFGSWAWELSTNIVTWTPGLYSLLEYNCKEVEGRIGLNFYLSHLLDEYSQTFQDILSTALKEKADFYYEYVIKTNSGALKTVSTRGKLVKDARGEVAKILCINRDITAVRTLEKDQERHIRELNRSNRDLEEFAYIASHDLQEPLRKISMFTERLKAKYDNALDNEGNFFIERILASAANMRTLIDDLLNFSRANRRSLTFGEVDFKSVFDSVISELDLKIEETGTVIRFSGTPPTIQAVTSEMKQLFANILSNAIKFRKQNVPPEIEVRSGKLSKTEKQTLGLPAAICFYRMEVQDNGIGFEGEYSERIFQIFQRLNGKAEYPGSGIGLAICKKIVEKHGGLIFAKSAPDRGSTFTVILPEKQF
ncbi:MAG: ATP-binding protein [Bacteroidota bacterium]|nr:ATP-binding protein [Bacteroidota bacterium]